MNLLNERNIDKLNRKLAILGFGNDWKEQIRSHMITNINEFNLPFSKRIGAELIKAGLHIKKLGGGKSYSLTGFDLTVYNNKTKRYLRHPFRFEKTGELTLLKSLNLANGRPVSKTFKCGDATNDKIWIILISAFNENIDEFKIVEFSFRKGESLESQLVRYPIMELWHANSAKRLIHSLKSGNRQSITMAQNEREVKGFINVCPFYRRVNVLIETC
jgi:hypothetical protein